MRNFEGVAALRSDWTRLAPAEQRRRAAVEEYLLGTRYSTRKHCVIRFRRFADFLRMPKDRWPRALDRFFALAYPAAERCVDRFLRWAVRQPGGRALLDSGGYGGFVRLTEFVERKGVIGWRIKQAYHRRAERDWEALPEAYRGHAEDWLRLQATRRLNPATLARFRIALVGLSKFFTGHGVPYDRARYDDAVGWFEETGRKHPSPGYVNGLLSVVRRFFRWLRRRGVIQESPFDELQALRIPRGLPRYLGERDVRKLLQHAAPGRDRAVCEVLYASGCRSCELAKLDLEDVSFSEGVARTKGKGGGDRILFLNREALAAIRKYLPVRRKLLESYGSPDPGALFLTYRGTRLRPGVVHGIVSKAGKAAGLPLTVYPHLLRHSFATHLLNRGADLYSLMQFLGHKTLEATQIYLHVATARLRQVYDHCHPRIRGRRGAAALYPSPYFVRGRNKYLR